MTAIGPYALVTFGGAQRTRKAVRAVGKTGARTRFDGERDDRRAPPSLICVARTLRQACQSDTVEDAQFWDGPPVRSEFAAQVLGQAMPTGVPCASAAAAYRKPVIRLLPLLDGNF